MCSCCVLCFGLVWFVLVALVLFFVAVNVDSSPRCVFHGVLQYDTTAIGNPARACFRSTWEECTTFDIFGRGDKSTLIRVSSHLVISENRLKNE